MPNKIISTEYCDGSPFSTPFDEVYYPTRLYLTDRINLLWRGTGGGGDIPTKRVDFLPNECLKSAWKLHSSLNATLLE